MLLNEFGQPTAYYLTQPIASAYYTPYYCEENVYKRLEQMAENPSYVGFKFWAVFISSPSRTSLLFHQKAAWEQEYVVWDYHAIVCSKGGSGKVYVEDPDSTLAFCDLRPEYDLRKPTDYALHTFRPDLYQAERVPPSYMSSFRVVPSEVFLANFASDRSHMLSHDSAAGTTTAKYIQPPPIYKPLQGKLARKRGDTNNLWTHFLNMNPGEGDEELYGVVLPNLEALDSYSWN